MPSIYFITDFSYNPDSENPLKVFELGDAFFSGYPDKKFGKDKISIGDRFFNYLQNQYPDALLIQVYPSGLNLIDISNGLQLLTNDKSDVFNDSVDRYASSFQTMIKLVQETIKHAEKRNEKSRLLLLHIGHPRVANNFNMDFKEDSRLKQINHGSKIINESFYNKKTFHDFAQNNPIYPNTIHLDLIEDNIESQINIFIEKDQADYYIIKPINGTRSEHVHVVLKSDLLSTLKQIKEGNCFPEARNRFLFDGVLIQACHLSKLIKYNEKNFFGKGRAFQRCPR